MHGECIVGSALVLSTLDLCLILALGLDYVSCRDRGRANGHSTAVQLREGGLGLGDGLEVDPAHVREHVACRMAGLAGVGEVLRGAKGGAVDAHEAVPSLRPRAWAWPPASTSETTQAASTRRLRGAARESLVTTPSETALR